MRTRTGETSPMTRARIAALPARAARGQATGSKTGTLLLTKEETESQVSRESEGTFSNYRHIVLLFDR